MLDVRILDEALRDLQRLDKPVSRRVVQRIRWLAEHFDEIVPERLTGDLSEFLKLRVGDYRVLYQVQHDEGLLIVYQVGHRRDIYR